MLLRAIDDTDVSPLGALLRAEIASAIDEGVGAQITELRRFVDRRIAELSMEISASVQMAEMTETAVVAQIANVHSEIARMIAAPKSETRTSGLELEAVVQNTEDAASKILEAAEAIQEWMCKCECSEATEQIGRKVQTIFEACSFQDLTSQRIRRAIAHLQQVDAMLKGISAPDAPLPEPVEAPDWAGGTGPDLGQASIDALLADF